jgi:hypothetical protein
MLQTRRLPNGADDHKKIARWLRHDDNNRLKWRGERLTKDTKNSIDHLHRDDMSHEEGAALFYYRRDDFFFDLERNDDPRVLLVRYEDLCAGPSYQFRQIFEFADCPFRSEFVKAIYASSVQRHTFPRSILTLRLRCLD